MDPAKEEPLRSAMDMQGVMLGRHEEELSAARLAVEGLTAQVTDLSSRLLMLYQDPSADPRRYPLHEPRINNPPCYAGEPTECRAFLTQCEVVFSLQPQTYAGDPARIAFVLSLLTGRAREWGTSAWEARTSCCGRYELFKEEMIKIFDRSVFGREASRLLTTLHQGRRSVADFAIEFRTLATTCEWNEPALVARFLEGLNMDLKEEIYARGPPAQLDQLIELGIRLDRCFEQRRRIRGPVSRPLETLTPAVVSSPLCSDPEPMQRGGVHISAEERERRIRSRLCLYCGANGHFAASCPLKGQSSPVDGGVLASATVISSLPRSRTTISVVIRWAGITVNGLALIDSGAEGSFIDERWAMEQGIPLLDLNDTTTVFALDGRALSTVHRITCPLSLTVSGNHRETIFFLFSSPLILLLF